MIAQYKKNICKPSYIGATEYYTRYSIMFTYIA